MDLESLPMTLERVEDLGDSSLQVGGTVNLLWNASRFSVQLVNTTIMWPPRAILRLLGMRLSFTLTFSTLITILGLLAVAVLLFVRYRTLTGYSKSVEERRDPPVADPFIGPRENRQKGRFGSYLDEFLIAIKVFGYLERPVFNELTRSMRTQKLQAGEVLDLDDNLGFAIVVEGNVQIFTKVENKDISTEDDEFGGETLLLNDQRYQLLNEIKTGNPLSSLVNILTLFTNEDSSSRGMSSPALRDRYSNGSLLVTKTGVEEIVPLNLDGDAVSFTDTPHIIAKATLDSTIAIIPAEAFTRLKRKHPRASSHIVQMILTRLYRVTFQTAHNYLGLTKELFETEKKLNSTAKMDLPSYLYDGLMKRMSKENSESDRGRSSMKATPTSAAMESDSSRRVKSPNANKRPVFPSILKNGSRHVVLESRDSFNPGDLLSNVPLSRKEITYQALFEDDVRSRPFSGDEETEDGALRLALVEGMFNFLGINKESLMPKDSPTGGSLLNSPVPLGHGLFNTIPRKSGTNSARSDSRSSKTRSYSITSAAAMEDYSNEQVDFHSAKHDFSEIIQIKKFETGTTLIEQNRKTNGIYYVVSGVLEVYYKDSISGKEHFLYDVQPGGIAGYLGSLIGYKSFVTVRAKSDAIVGVCSDRDIERLFEKYFMIYLTIAKALVNSLTTKILKLDSALEWIQLEAGETLTKQGTSANGIYIILSGRLRSIQEDPSTKESKDMGEYSQGESFGEVEVLTAAKRSSSYVAVRDTEVARIPRTLFEILCLENPSIMIKVSRIVANTVKEQIPYLGVGVPSSSKLRSVQKRYKTITILPTTSGLPVAEFAAKLVQSFKNVNVSVIGLDQASTLSHLGKYAFDKLSTLRQSGFFSDVEERYEIVVYIADTAVNSTWTSTCIQQGDCILLLSDALSDPGIGDYERLLLKTRTSARTELILLHPEKYVAPGLTSKWLKNRIWVNSHHHIQLNYKQVSVTSQNAQMTFADNIRNTVETLTLKYMNLKNKKFYTSTLPHKNDFMRLARLLSGQAVGVVLGGGGARGFSHLGLLKALQENGIPIDIIGGTSIGSFVGGLYAKEYDLVPIYGRAKKFAGRVGSFWRILSDFTIPITAYTTGHEFNRGIWKAFGESRIEDFWIQYFCNSTNITNSCMEIHTSGHAWRFIRASMSLAGLLPPITDNGSMLLDGGYVDNLPVDEMKNRGASIIFAVDVGSVDDRTPMTYGDSLSGSWNLLNRWNPFSSSPTVPAMSEIQLRLCYVASVNALERAKNTPGVIYLRPPIENYATLDFGKFDEIYNVGAVYGHMAINDLIDTNKMPKIAGAGEMEEQQRSQIQRRHSM